MINRILIVLMCVILWACAAQRILVLITGFGWCMFNYYWRFPIINTIVWFAYILILPYWFLLMNLCCITHTSWVIQIVLLNIICVLEGVFLSVMLLSTITGMFQLSLHFLFRFLNYLLVDLLIVINIGLLTFSVVLASSMKISIIW